MKRKIFLFFIFLFNIFIYSDEIGFEHKDFFDSFINFISSTQKGITIVSPDFTDKNFLDILKEKKDINKTVILSKSSISKKYSLKDSLSLFVDTLLFADDSLINYTIIFSTSKSFIICNKAIQPKKYSKDLFYINSSNSSMFENLYKKYLHIRKYSFSIDSFKDTLDFNQIIKNYKNYENSWIRFKAYVVDVYRSKKSDTYFIKLKGDKNFTIVIFKNLSKEFFKKNLNILYFKNKNIIVEGFLKYDKKYGYEIILDKTNSINILK
uniref:Uncharacterized protein n=1 Tax=candidate division WOR-3 bacterium TaxID=2052148 RepID=A0A7C3J6U2_UNCW3